MRIQNINPWRLCVAPMLDWTDLHCRYLHRLITQHTRLYTEMVTTGALLYGDVDKHLRFNTCEHPLALQLGGSNPQDLAACAKLARQWQYDEINLNCGCPSERVQSGSFGACLMHEPTLVADCIKAMQDVVDIPVTVKNRIGIDKNESYGFVRDFIGCIADTGCKTFIVHARNAWLKGLSPKENRDIPPLRYEIVYQLKKDFPELTIVINGGIKNNAEIQEHLAHVDGVMVGREAYHNPYLMAEWDALFYDDHHPVPTRQTIEQQMVAYCQTAVDEHHRWPQIMRHMLGLRHAQPGARVWRQMWSDHHDKHLPVEDVYTKIQQHQSEAHTKFS